MSPNTSPRHRPIYLYFGLLTLLIYFLSPEYFLDIPTAYMLKNRLHASAPEVSMFRLLSGIPLYVGFLFGLVRDLWNPFGWRDRGYFFLFAPVTAAIFLWMAFSPLSWTMLLTGMILAMATFRLMFAAYQGLIALIGQESSLSGRLSTLSNTVFTVGIILAAVISGMLSENLSPKQIFILIAVAMLSIAFFGLWKPRTVFGRAYDQPQAKGSDFSGDVKRLLAHRAIYPAVLITFLWNFNPILYTPMQFYLTNQLHASDDTYSNFLGIFSLGLVPTFLLYGWLCTKFPPSKLLWWATFIAIPQMVPMLLIHSASSALLLAAPIGLMGGMATAAYFDLAVRSCPEGLQGTLMMLVSAGWWLATRGSDLVGAKLYAASVEMGFRYCVGASVAFYILILPLILWIPKEVIATTDGQPVIPAREADDLRPATR